MLVLVKVKKFEIERNLKVSKSGIRNINVTSIKRDHTTDF